MSRWCCSALVALLLGCSGADEAEQLAPLDTDKDHVPSELRVVLGSEPASLDPHKTNMAVESRTLMYLMQGLMELSPEGTVQGGAAEEWQVSDDGLTWRFKLRPGLQWSDGVSITAEDFVYSFRRALDPITASRSAEQLYDIVNAEEIQKGQLPVTELGVTAEDPIWIRFDLKRPNPYFDSVLVSTIAMPVPRHVVEAHGEAWVRPENWVSNGTYTLSRRIPGDRLELTSVRPNETYFDNVFFIPIIDPKVAYNRYRAGEVHAIPDLPRDIDLAEVEGDLREWTFAAYLLLGFNHTKAPFDDVNVRRALSLAIDQEFVARTIHKPPQIPAYGFVPKFVDPEAPNFPPRPENWTEEAKRLLAQAGFTESNPLELVLRYSTRELKSIPVGIMGAWQQIGVSTTLEGKEPAIHYSELRTADYDVALSGRLNPARSEQFIYEFAEDALNENLSRYRDPAVSDLWEKLQGEPDKDIREKVSREIQQILIDDVVAIPLYFRQGRGLVRPEIQGWVDNYYNVHPLKNLSWQE